MPDRPNDPPQEPKRAVQPYQQQVRARATTEGAKKQARHTRDEQKERTLCKMKLYIGNMDSMHDALIATAREYGSSAFLS